MFIGIKLYLIWDIIIDQVPLWCIIIHRFLDHSDLSLCEKNATLRECGQRHERRKIG